jgi:hypothetical protein
MRRSRISKEKGEEIVHKEEKEKKRNSFCCNACICPVPPHSCHYNGQKLVHQLISIRLERSNVDFGHFED